MSHFKVENSPNSISAGAPPQTLLVELTALPRLPSWIKGVLLLKGGEETGEEGEKEGEGEEWGKEGRDITCMVVSRPWQH